MFRTRSLALVAAFTSAGALGAAVALFDTSVFGQNQLAALGLAVSDEEKTFSAALAENGREFNFDERVSELKEKIAGRTFEDNLVEETVSEEASSTSEIVDTAESDEDMESALVEKRCNLYQASGSLWDARGVKMQVSEGARVFYKNGTAAVAVGTSTTPAREILIELPLRSNASGAYCIPTDVIGITETGFLIRNNEVALFASYGANTLVGYALDGLPIYGASSAKTDQCGGALVGGQYRYILDSKRDTIIACYVGAPIAI